MPPISVQATDIPVDIQCTAPCNSIAAMGTKRKASTSSVGPTPAKQQKYSDTALQTTRGSQVDKLRRAKGVRKIEEGTRLANQQLVSTVANLYHEAQSDTPSDITIEIRDTHTRDILMKVRGQTEKGNLHVSHQEYNPRPIRISFATSPQDVPTWEDEQFFQRLFSQIQATNQKGGTKYSLKEANKASIRRTPLWFLKVANNILFGDSLLMSRMYNNLLDINTVQMVFPGATATQLMEIASWVIKDLRLKPLTCLIAGGINDYVQAASPFKPSHSLTDSNTPSRIATAKQFASTLPRRVAEILQKPSGPKTGLPGLEGRPGRTLWVLPPVNTPPTDEEPVWDVTTKSLRSTRTNLNECLATLVHHALIAENKPDFPANFSILACTESFRVRSTTDTVHMAIADTPYWLALVTKQAPPTTDQPTLEVLWNEAAAETACVLGALAHSYALSTVAFEGNIQRAREARTTADREELTELGSNNRTRTCKLDDESTRLPSLAPLITKKNMAVQKEYDADVTRTRVLFSTHRQIRKPMLKYRFRRQQNRLSASLTSMVDAVVTFARGDQKFLDLLMDTSLQDLSLKTELDCPVLHNKQVFADTTWDTIPHPTEQYSGAYNMSLTDLINTFAIFGSEVCDVGFPTPPKIPKTVKIRDKVTNQAVPLDNDVWHALTMLVPWKIVQQWNPDTKDNQYHTAKQIVYSQRELIQNQLMYHHINTRAMTMGQMVMRLAVHPAVVRRFIADKQRIFWGPKEQLPMRIPQQWFRTNVAVYTPQHYVAGNHYLRDLPVLEDTAFTLVVKPIVYREGRPTDLCPLALTRKIVRQITTLQECTEQEAMRQARENLEISVEPETPVTVELLDAGVQEVIPPALPTDDDMQEQEQVIEDSYDFLMSSQPVIVANTADTRLVCSFREARDDEMQVLIDATITLNEEQQFPQLSKAAEGMLERQNDERTLWKCVERQHDARIQARDPATPRHFALQCYHCDTFGAVETQGPCNCNQSTQSGQAQVLATVPQVSRVVREILARHSITFGTLLRFLTWTVSQSTMKTLLKTEQWSVLSVGAWDVEIPANTEEHTKLQTITEGQDHPTATPLRVPVELTITKFDRTGEPTEIFHQKFRVPSHLRMKLTHPDAERDLTEIQKVNRQSGRSGPLRDRGDDYPIRGHV